MKSIHKAWKYPIICILCMGPLLFSFGDNPVYAFSDQIIQKGATGDDVVELQARLQYNGFYTGNIDGVYGWSTYWSVRNFQKEFGMEVDGLVGPKMKNMLERATKYNKEFVHEALQEGRKFTHYGGMPLEHQKGPKGSKGQQSPNQGSQGQGGQSPNQGSQGQGGQSPNQGGQGQGGQTPNQGGQGQGGQTPNQGSQGQGGQTPQQGDQAQVGQTGEGQTAQENPQQEPQQGGQEQQTPAPEQNPAEEQPAPQAPDEEKPQSQGNEVNIKKAMNVPDGYSENDIKLMAQAVYGEARGEPYIGQVAIAAVIINRVNSPTFPNNASGVIFEPRAFTAVADGQIWLTPNETAKRAVLDALNGQDPSDGATYYFNPDTATSGWIWTRPQIKKIGKHIFAN